MPSLRLAGAPSAGEKSGKGLESPTVLSPFWTPFIVFRSVLPHLAVDFMGSEHYLSMTQMYGSGRVSCCLRIESQFRL